MSLVPCERQAELSFAQQRLWFLDQYQPGSALYNVPEAVRLEGTLDAAALERAFTAVVRRHESLRTTFQEREGGPVQVIHPATACHLEVEDLQHLPASEREGEALRRMHEEARVPFCLSQGPLLRTRLFRLSEREHLLLVTVHHIVSDGWSTAVLIREVARLYEAFCQGRPSPLPELPLQYADFARWQRESLRGDVLERQLAWWKRQLDGMPPAVELPTDWPRTAGTDQPGAVLKVELPLGLTRMLRGFCRAEGATLFMGLLAGLQVLLARYSGQDDVCVGVPVAGRTRPDTEGLIGFFVNTLVLRTRLSGDPTFRELLGRVKEATLGAYSHQEVPFEKLVEALQPPRQAGRTPFFQVALVLHNQPPPELELPGLRLRKLDVHSGASKFDLSLALTETAQGLSGKLEYRGDLYAPATAARMMEHLVRLLEAALADPGQRVSALALLSETERRRVLRDFAATSGDALPAPPVPALIEAQAALHPLRPAVECEGQVLTYGQLDARARQLAGHLRSLGVGPESRVALCLERSVDTVVALLAVWKAGGAYVPLDPEWPAARLEALVRSVQAPVVITVSRHAEAVAPLAAHTVVLDTLVPGDSPQALPGTVHPEQAAYVLFTSGSTGKPKGVVVSHGQLAAYVQAAAERLGLRECVSFALVSTFVADLGNTVLFPALCTGGLLHVLTRECAASPAAAAAYFQRHPADCLKLTPSHLSALLTAPEPRHVLPRKRLVLGGEPPSPALLEQVRALAPDCQVFNHYGPTETAVGVLAGPLSAASGVALGRPLAGTRVYVLDARMRPVPPGVPGELYIGGAQVTRGYVGCPDLTAERYVPDPYGQVPGARLYRTGDRVRWLEDGRVEFLGRADFQVKVRGFRVEPGEVESALRLHGAVRDAVVVAREDATGGVRLVAYAVLREPLTVEQLRAHASGQLPGHMVPSAFVVLEALPLTSNGKVDRQALPAPESSSAAGVHVAPRTPLEARLAEVFAEVLRVPRASITDSFFELGGHSLLATQLVSRIRASLGVELPLRALFEAPTVETLAPRLERLLRSDPSLLAAPPLRAVERTGPLPLSFAQQRLWFLDQFQSQGTVYNLPMALRLEGTLDRRALQRSFEEVVRRHEALRTTFHAEGGQPFQVISGPHPLSIGEEDLTALAPEQRGAEALRLALEEARRPFDLSTGPLVRMSLFRLAPEEHVLVLSMHHIVSDAWSSGVLVRELVALYEAFREGRPSPLPEPRVQYADYAAWQRGWLKDGVLGQQLSWWRTQLEGAPQALELPTDRPRPALQSFQGARHPVQLPGPLSARLKDFCQREGVTPFMTLLAAWQLLLSRYSGQDDVSVGTPIAGRRFAELEELIGFFVNMLVLRSRIRPDASFRELLAQVRATALGAFEHQDVPFEKLVEELHPRRDLGRSPLFQVAFSLQNAPATALAVPGLVFHPLELEGGVARFDLTLMLSEREDGFGGIVEYDTALFDASTVARMMGHLEGLLQQVLETPEARLDGLPLLSRAEREQVLVEWNATTAEYPRTASVPEVFTQVAARFADRVAVEAGEGALTYRQLDERTHQLAHHLRALGVAPGSRVGLCVERSLELVVGMLGILKAGAAFVPLDPSHPAERLDFMLSRSGVSVLLTQEHLAATLAARVPMVVCLDSGVGQEQPRTALHGHVDADSLAYVMFTSGSTGQPKAVAVPHRGITRLVLGGAFIHFGPEEVFLQLAPSSFDASTLEVWGALLHGARLVLLPPRTPSLEELGAALVHHGVTTLWLTAPLFEQMALHQPQALASVRQLLSGGDVLPAARVREHLARLAPGAVLVNGYGPTENTTFTTCHRMEAGSTFGASVPIGRPIAHTRVYVLDAALRPVPVGVAGELYTAGDGLAWGYLGQADLTAERFVPSPFGQGERLYRTGDKARWLADGTLEFLGRDDGQVKVRGFRVELAEVEGALRQHPWVHEAVAVVRDDAAGGRRLVAYAVAPGAEASVLKEALRQKLPEYMVPSALVLLDALPLSPNGKVDRKALPVPEARTAGPESYVAPRTPTEALLAGLFSEVLGVQQVGLHEDFFELGGHSLLATQLVSRVRAALGEELALRELFEAPTVEQLARRLETPRPGAFQPPPLTRASRHGALPLSFAQQRLWFLDQLQPGALYNVPFVLRLEGALDVLALQQAFQHLVHRHESLRTTFRAEGGQPVQVIHAPSPFHLDRVDLTGLPPEQRELEALRLAREEARRPFELATGPLLRVSLYRLAPEAHVLLLAMHHIVSDGWSMGVLVRDVAALYEASCQGRSSPLPGLPVQYADYAAWQRGWLKDEVLERHLGWWKQRLAGLPPVLELPTDKPRPAALSQHGDQVPVHLPPELTGALDALCQREGVTPFMVLLAAWQLLLSRYSGQDDLAVGTPIAGRTRAEVEGLIGFFVNTLVLRAKLDGQASFRQLLAQVRATTLAAYEHQDLPFEKLVEELAPQRSLSHTPLFQVMLVLQNTPMRTLDAGPLRLRPVDAELQLTKFDLTLFLTETPAGFSGTLGYRTSLFERATVTRMVGHLRTLLQAAVSTPEARLDALPLMSAGERHLVVKAWNDTRHALPWEGCLHERFESQAALTPGAPAVLDGTDSLTFAALNHRANQLAHALRQQGAGPEVRVALCLERGVDPVVAVLAVLKSGAAYVPLDPAYPGARLAFMLQDCGAGLVLTQRHLASRLEGAGARVLCLDGADVREALARQPTHNPAPLSEPGHLAYVIYTSGSTGQPKGVQVQHASLMNLRGALQRAVYADGEGPRRVSLNAPLAFDGSVKQLLRVADGDTLCVVPRAAREDVALLKAWVESHRVDVLDCSPAHLRLLLDEGLGEARPLRVLVGGEAVDEALWARVAAHPHLRAFNVYGPTECTVDATAYEVRPGTRPCLGSPLANVRVYVLDARMQPVPVGVAGELFIGGAGVARGYLGRPDLTAESFVPDPFSPEEGARLYRTGDKVRWLATGELEYLGRVDFQVKLRGFRIEPGEVEKALEQHPALRQAVVLAREDVPGLKRLVAYVVPRAGTGVDTGGLRAFLQQRLPDYLVPAAFVPLESLPLNTHGKLDRGALPPPEAGEGSEAREWVAPRTPLEERLAALTAEVLRLERVGLHEDFFALGGHSLLATQLVSRIQRALDVELPLRALFEGPTVAALARRIETGPQVPPRPLPPLVPAPRNRPVPLNFTQERMWKVVKANPTTTSFNQTNAWRFKGALHVEALQAALRALVERHESLRTTFVEEDGRPVQKVSADFRLEVPLVDLRARANPEAEAVARVSEEERQPFDLVRGPLVRASIFRLKDDEHLLLLGKHHILSDGWSMGVLVREVAELYTAFAAGRPSPLPPLKFQYADYAAWQRGWLTGQVLESRLGYWRSALAGAPQLLELPTDKPRPAMRTFRGTTLPVDLGPERSAAFQALCQREHVTAFMALLALYGAVLCQRAGQEEALIGSPIANRTLPELEPMIGLFLNTLALRVDLRGRPSFRQLFGRVRDATLGAYAHQEVPFEYVVEAVAGPRPPNRTPLFQVMFTLQNAPREDVRLPGLTPLPVVKPARGASMYEMTLVLAEREDGIRGGLEFNTDLFEPASMERLRDALLALIDRALAHPEAPVGLDEAVQDVPRKP